MEVGVGSAKVVRRVGRLVYTVGEGELLQTHENMTVEVELIEISHMVCEGGRPCDRW